MGMHLLHTHLLKNNQPSPELHWLGDNATVKNILSRSNWQASHQEKSKLLKWILTCQKSQWPTCQATCEPRSHPDIKKVDALSKQSRTLPPPPDPPPQHIRYWINQLSQHEPLLFHTIHTPASPIIQYGNLCPQLHQRQQQITQSLAIRKHDSDKTRPDPRLLWKGKHVRAAFRLKRAGYEVSTASEQAFYLRAGVWDYPFRQHQAQCHRCKTPATFEHFVMHCSHPELTSHRLHGHQAARRRQEKYIHELTQAAQSATLTQNTQPLNAPHINHKKKKQRPLQPPLLLPSQVQEEFLPTSYQPASPPATSKFRTAWLWKGHLPNALQAHSKDWQQCCRDISFELQAAAIHISRDVLRNHNQWLTGMSSPPATSALVAAQQQRIDRRANSDLAKAQRAQEQFARNKQCSSAARNIRAQLKILSQQFAPVAHQDHHSSDSKVT